MPTLALQGSAMSPGVLELLKLAGEAYQQEVQALKDELERLKLVGTPHGSEMSVGRLSLKSARASVQSTGSFGMSMGQMQVPTPEGTSKPHLPPILTSNAKHDRLEPAAPMRGGKPLPTTDMDAPDGAGGEEKWSESQQPGRQPRVLTEPPEITMPNGAESFHPFAVGAQPVPATGLTRSVFGEVPQPLPLEIVTSGEESPKNPQRQASLLSSRISLNSIPDSGPSRPPGRRKRRASSAPSNLSFYPAPPKERGGRDSRESVDKPRRSVRSASQGSAPAANLELQLALARVRREHSSSAMGVAENGGSPPLSARTSRQSNKGHMDESGIQLHDVWMMMAPDAAPQRKSGRCGSGRANTLDIAKFDPDHSKPGNTSENRDMTTMMGRHMFRPATQKQIIWDVCGLFCILFDLLWMPLQVFDLGSEKDHMVLILLQWFATLFWTCDIPRTFMLGYNCRDGTIEMRPRKVANAYICSWFFMDITLVVLDWLVFLASSITGGLGLFRTLKSFRIGKSLRLIRMFKVVRVLKVTGVFQDIAHQIGSMYVLALGKIMCMMGAILLCNHCIACIWYGLTQVPHPQDDDWTLQFIDVGKSDNLFLYTTALHWSLTQFTPASMNVNPTNSVERIFNVFVVLFAMVIFTQLVGSITSTMTELKNLDSQKTRKMMELRKFLSQHKVSSGLTSRIWQCVNSAKQARQKARINDIALLQMLPRRVLAELREEVYKPIFTCHPFFRNYMVRNQPGMNQLYSNAMGSITLEAEEELFTAGDSAEKAMFVVSGRFRYQLGFREDKRFDTLSKFPVVTEEHDKQDVLPGTWVCEITLWLRWSHRGTMVAEKTGGDVYTLDAKAFRDTIGGYSQVDDMLPRYAALYERHAIKYLQEMDIWWDIQMLENMTWAAAQDDFNPTTLAPSGCCSLPSLYGLVDPTDGLEEWHADVKRLRTSGETPMAAGVRKGGSWLQPMPTLPSPMARFQMPGRRQSF